MYKLMNDHGIIKHVEKLKNGQYEVIGDQYIISQLAELRSDLIKYDKKTNIATTTCPEHLQIVINNTNRFKEYKFIYKEVKHMYKNVNEFIEAYYKKNPDGHYFDRETLKFFGERISDMYLLKKTVKVKDISGVEHEAYVLSRLQRKHPDGPKRTYAYFDINTLTPIIIK